MSCPSPGGTRGRRNEWGQPECCNQIRQIPPIDRADQVPDGITSACRESTDAGPQDGAPAGVRVIREPRYRHWIMWVFAVVGAIYFLWRPTVFNWDAPVYSIVFFLAEFYGYAVSLIMMYIAYRIVTRTPSAPQDGLRVAVFVPTLNEPVAVVRRTLLGAINMDYPHETWLLDDGNRTEMRDLAGELGVRYLAREKNTNAKAGNLNHGLEHCDADFVATFDADHVADRNFLTKTLGYFRNPRLAMVQTPQDYYNTNAFQYLKNNGRRLVWHEQSLFHYVGQTGRDFHNAATCCGCSMVMRRTALDEVGGFAVETVTEDMHTMVRMQKRGWETVYHDEPLAYGIAPSDYGGFLRQRLRWGEGNLQVCREEGLPFTGRMSMAQRLGYFTLTTPYLEGWHKLILYVGPILVLFTGIAPLDVQIGEFALFFLPFYLLAMLYSTALGRGYGRIFATEKFNMAKFVMAMYSTLGLVRRNIRFRTSSKRLNGNFPIISIVPLIVLTIAAIWAIAYNQWRYLEGLPGHMPYWLSLVISVWCAMIAWFALWTIWHAVRCARNKDTEYQFQLTLPVCLTDKTGQQQWVMTRSLSGDRIEIAGSDLAGIAPGQVSARLFLPGANMAFDATVDVPGGPRGTTSVTPVWHSNADRDQLDLTLISCGWHRRWQGQVEAEEIWYVRLARRLFQGPEPRARAWRPAVVRAAGSANDLEFSLVDLGVNSSHPQRILFYDTDVPEGALEVLVFATDGVVADTLAVTPLPMIAGGSAFAPPGIPEVMADCRPAILTLPQEEFRYDPVTKSVAA